MLNKNYLYELKIIKLLSKLINNTEHYNLRNISKSQVNYLLNLINII